MAQALGHLSLAYMRKVNLLVPKNICSPCQGGKATRQPFWSQKWPRSKPIIECLHSDIGGPIRTSTSVSEKYYQTIIDYYSHFVTV